MQVNLYKAVVERVKPARTGLHSKISSLSSKGSSDWGEVFASSPELPKGEGGMSPGGLSNMSSSTEAAWSYNRISSPASVSHPCTLIFPFIDRTAGWKCSHCNTVRLSICSMWTLLYLLLFPCSAVSQNNEYLMKRDQTHQCMTWWYLYHRIG